ncbi:MAG: hypothetical protein PHW34_05800 [Hespellia sp.]|nr:hypothetical protein [Hespellia sp.]
MNSQKKKVLCMILLLSIVFSAICFKSVKTDVFGVSNSENHSAFHYQIGSDRLSDVDISTTEMMGTRGISTSSIQESISKTAPTERAIRLTAVFFCALLLYWGLSIFYFTANLVITDDKRYVAVLLNYIHNQDGKKRI